MSLVKHPLLVALDEKLNTAHEDVAGRSAAVDKATAAYREALAVREAFSIARELAVKYLAGPGK